MPPRKKPGIVPLQRSDGTTSYEIRWRQGGGRDGRRLSHTEPTIKRAQDRLTQIAANGYVCTCAKHAPDGVTPTAHYGRPDARPAKRLTFGERAFEHAAALTGVGPGYRAQFRRDLERHLQPFLDMPLDGITDLDVRKWIRGMEDGTHPWLRGPISPTTVRRLLAQAGAVIAGAQRDGIVARNPFKGHRLARRDRDQHTEMNVLTEEEWASLQAALPAGVYRDMATVLVGTGLRWGEVTALAVGAVDPFARPPRLHVSRAWQDDGAGGYQIGTPKSKRSRRTVEFHGPVLDALIPHLSGKRSDELVFTTTSGAPIRHSNFYNRIWVRACRAASALVWAHPLVSRPRIHDLRHTHVSWLVTGGLDVAAVSRRVGHESITTTVDRYHHILPQVNAAALAALEVAMPTRPR